MSSQLGRHAIIPVNYVGESHPRPITLINSIDGLINSDMMKSGAHWEWPAKPNKINYSKDKIVQLINPSK